MNPKEIKWELHSAYLEGVSFLFWMPKMVFLIYGGSFRSCISREHGYFGQAATELWYYFSKKLLLASLKHKSFVSAKL